MTRWSLPFVMEALLVLLALRADWRTNISLVLFGYGLLFIAFLAALHFFRNEKRIWPWLGCALLFRLTLLPGLPTLSQDVYRYAWEGRVQQAGFSPSEHAPESAELVGLRDDLYAFLDHKHVTTIYPVLTQWTFRMGTYIGGMLQRALGKSLRAEIVAQKVLFVFFDVMTILALLWFLRLRGKPFILALYYAWNPLVLIEIAGSGHNDPLGIFLLVLGFALWERGKSLGGSLSLAASFLAKYLSFLLLPFFLFKRRFRELGVWTAVVACGTLFGGIALHSLVGGTRYITHWQFNGSLFWLLTGLLGGNTLWAKWAVTALLGAVAVWIGYREKDLPRAGFLIIAASLLMAPTLHPWYFVWLIPLLCVFRPAGFVVWNGTIVISYFVWPEFERTKLWQLPFWAYLAEYLPVFLTLGSEGYRRWHVARNPV
jgi:alpha-1,6-mannosyltransferase